MAADPLNLLGKTLAGHFLVEALIGEGRASVVYRGVHVGPQEPVALRCLKLGFDLDAEQADTFLRRFREEIRPYSRVGKGHAAFVRTIGSGMTTADSGEHVPYVVLEMLEGQSLAADIEARRTMGVPPRTPREALDLLAGAMEAVAAAHEGGLAHGDLTTGGIFLSRPGGDTPAVRVLDLGISRVLDAVTQEVAPDLKGDHSFDPAYGAPEQHDAKLGTLGPAADVYALAMILLEILRDKPVTKKKVAASVALDRVRRPTPRVLGMRVSDALEEVIAKAVKLAPRERWPNARELLTALRAAVAQEASVASSVKPKARIKDEWAPDDEYASLPPAPRASVPARAGGADVPPAPPTPTAPASSPTAVGVAAAPSAPALRPAAPAVQGKGLVPSSVGAPGAPSPPSAPHAPASASSRLAPIASRLAVAAPAPPSAPTPVDATPAPAPIKSPVTPASPARPSPPLAASAPGPPRASAPSPPRPSDPAAASSLAETMPQAAPAPSAGGAPPPTPSSKPGAPPGNRPAAPKLGQAGLLGPPPAPAPPPAPPVPAAPPSPPPSRNSPSAPTPTTPLLRLQAQAQYVPPPPPMPMGIGGVGTLGDVRAEAALSQRDARTTPARQSGQMNAVPAPPLRAPAPADGAPPARTSSGQLDRSAPAGARSLGGGVPSRPPPPPPPPRQHSSPPAPPAAPAPQPMGVSQPAASSPGPPAAVHMPPGEHGSFGEDSAKVALQAAAPPKATAQPVEDLPSVIVDDADTQAEEVLRQDAALRSRETLRLDKVALNNPAAPPPPWGTPPGATGASPHVGIAVPAAAGSGGLPIVALDGRGARVGYATRKARSRNRFIWVAVLSFVVVFLLGAAALGVTWYWKTQHDSTSSPL